MSSVEMIAEGAWDRMQYSLRYDIRLGEETLTELLLLDFVNGMPAQRFRLYQFTKQEESRYGADIEIVVEDGGRAVVFAVQAKKLSRCGRYDSLNAKTSGTNRHQIDVLENYSSQIGAIPFYLLYNHTDKPQQSWHCCQKFDEKQLSCTLVPSWEIRRAINKRGSRTFDAVHSRKSALPWRCLFVCPYPGWRKLVHEARQSLTQTSKQIGNFRDYDWLTVALETIAVGSRSSGGEEEGLLGWQGDHNATRNAWPEWLWDRDSTILSSEDAYRLRRGRQRSVRAQFAAVTDVSEPLLSRRLLLYRPQPDANETDADRS